MPRTLRGKGCEQDLYCIGNGKNRGGLENKNKGYREFEAVIVQLFCGDRQ